MFAQRRMYDTAVEEYFRCVGDVVEGFERLFEFIIVIVSEGGNPSLDFLEESKSKAIALKLTSTYLLQRHCDSLEHSRRRNESEMSLMIFISDLRRNCLGRGEVVPVGGGSP